MIFQKKEDITKLQKKLKRKLSEHRYQHSLGVSYTAGCLAMKYSLEIDKAIIAGLLHDCAKYMTPEEMYHFAQKKEIDMTPIEAKKPDLLHAKIGSYLTTKKYHIKDKEINDAIICHTTGKPNMTTFEKILFVADYIEPNRNKQPRLDVIRRVAFEDLDESIRMILQDTLSYLIENNSDIDDMTEKTYNFYLNKK